jgi:hypothetical protein
MTTGVLLELFVMLSNCYTFYVALVLYLIVVKRKEAQLVTSSSSSSCNRRRWLTTAPTWRVNVPVQLSGLFEIMYFAFVATAAATMSLIPLYEVNGLKYTAGCACHYSPPTIQPHLHSLTQMRRGVYSFSLSLSRVVGWCWVPAKPTYGRFVMNYVWVWTAILSIIIFYFLILRHIRRGTPMAVPCERVSAPDHATFHDADRNGGGEDQRTAL